MAQDLGWEIRLYRNDAPQASWAQQDIITEYKAFNFTKVLNGEGTGSITFDSKSLTQQHLDALGRDSIFAFCKPGKYGVDTGLAQGTDIVFGILPENVEHSILGPNKHEVKISGPGVGAVLDRSVVLPSGYAPGGGGPDTRQISAIRPTDVWVDMRNESAARGAAGVLAPPYVFTDPKAVDSANVAWDPAIAMNIVFEVRSGTGLLEVLKWAQAFGGFNFLVDYTQRNPVQAYVFLYQTFRKDVSSKVGLHLGRHVLSANKNISRESTMSNVYSSFVSGGGSRINAIVNGDAQFKYGVREFYWTDASDYLFADAQALANKLANSRRAAAETTTLRIVPNVDFSAFIDYDLFDQITYDNSELGIRGKYIVMGIAVEVSDQTETQEVLLETPIETFNRRLYAENNRLQQRFKYNSRILQ